MLNCLQLVVRAAMFEDLKFPANATALNQGFITIASFDIIDTGKYIDEYVFFFPEAEAFSLNF